MKLRLLAGVAVLLSVVPLAGLTSAEPVAALAPSATAYWIKTGTALPIVPPGGMFVATDPSAIINPNQPPALPVPLPAGVPVPVPNVPPLPGPKLTGSTAISAVRITGINPTADVTLTLSVFTGSAPPIPSISTIVACPIVTAWTPPPGGVGDISNLPPSNCSTPSVGRVASDFSTISFNLPASFQGSPGEFDVELQPGTATVPATFAVVFNAPTSKSVTAGAGGPVETIPDTTPPALTNSPPVVAAPSFQPPSVVAPISAPAPRVTTVPTVRPSSKPGSVFSQLAGVSVPGVTDDRGHRIMAVVLLFAIALALWLLGGRNDRAPRRVGALAESMGATSQDADAVEGGVGRFRRARTERPRRL